ncbi:MAG: hypothetical protein WC494_00220 [Candidatus Pacearchaeota archaeon]
MAEEDEPPNQKDKEGILLLPDRTQNEIAVCNASVCPTYIPNKGYPVLTRVRLKADNGYGECSIIKRGFLITPTKMSEDYKVFLSPDDNYSKYGREDARIVQKGGEYYITSIAFDGENTRVMLDTSGDLEEVTPRGVICDIPLERAVEIAGKNSYYGRFWKRNLRDSPLERKTQLLGIKDVALEFLPDGKVGIFYRMEPNMQFSVADDISDFFRRDYWENEIENLMDRTIMTREKGETKIGLGGPPITINGEKIGTYHKVTYERQGNLDVYYYSGSFFSFDPQKRQITARLRNPLLTPKRDDALVEVDQRNRLRTIKLVSFPMGMIVNPQNLNELYIYYGGGDEREAWRTTQIPWLVNELKTPFNSEKVVDFEE